MLEMETSRRQRCHVRWTSAGTTMMMMMMWLVMAGILTPVSCMLFQNRPIQRPAQDCSPWLSNQNLQRLTSGATNLTHIFHHLLPNILVSRVSGSQGNVMVRQFIKQEMARMGWYVEEDGFQDQTPYGEIAFTNVIATLDPSKAKRVVLACHYDSKLMPGFVGATDSAVPCSLMIETARWFQQVPDNVWNNVDFTLQLIFFDGEEAFVRWSADDSLYGSRHLANLWQQTPDRNDPAAANNLQNIQLFILMDLIGSWDTKFVNYYTNTSHHFNRLVNIEQCLRNSRQLSRRHTRTIFDASGMAEMVEDDHTPFIHKGVPVLHLISTPFPGVWHTVYDNVHYLNRGLIDNFFRIFSLYLTSLLVSS